METVISWMGQNLSTWDSLTHPSLVKKNTVLDGLNIPWVKLGDFFSILSMGYLITSNRPKALDVSPYGGINN